MNKIIVTVAGEAYPLNRLTLGEIAAIERVTHKSFAEIEASAITANILQALVWVALKRKTPTLRYADTDDIAIEDVKLDLGGGDEAGPPDEGAGDEETT